MAAGRARGFPLPGGARGAQPEPVPQGGRHLCRLGRRYPRSGYAADALYWEAFALYRLGGENDLRTALGRLETQKARFPKAGTSGDAVTLTTRIQGELARRGDAEAAATVTATAGSSASGSSSSGGRGVATTRATGRSTADAPGAGTPAMTTTT